MAAEKKCGTTKKNIRYLKINCSLKIHSKNELLRVDMNEKMPLVLSQL